MTPGQQRPHPSAKHSTRSRVINKNIAFWYKAATRKIYHAGFPLSSFIRKMKVSIFASAIALTLGGCASIFNGPTQAVMIKSEPDGATVSVMNRAGEKIHAGTTPVTLTLKRGAGFFKPETYTVSFAKPGFSKKEVNVTGTVSGWYIGNILFGGVVGLLAVDPATGAMYVLPDSVSGVMEAEAETRSPKVSQTSDTVRIVSTDSVTPEQMKDARLLTAVK